MNNTVKSAIILVVVVLTLIVGVVGCLYVNMITNLFGPSENTEPIELEKGQILTLEVLKRSHQILITDQNDIILVFNPSTDIYNAYWNLVLYDSLLRFVDETDFPSYRIFKMDGYNLFAAARIESGRNGMENYQQGRQLGSYRLQFTDSFFSARGAPTGKLIDFDLDIQRRKATLFYYEDWDTKIEKASKSAHIEVPIEQLNWIYPNRLTPPNGGFDVVTEDAKDTNSDEYLLPDSTTISRFLDTLLLRLEQAH